MDNQSFTCPNPSCGKVFSSPLKAENRASKKGHSYDACPYCLTEIMIDASSPIDKEEPKTVVKTVETGGPSVPRMQEKSAQPTVSAACTHQLGYLSKRSPKEMIPEECMMCSSIVQCMLKNVAE